MSTEGERTSTTMLTASREANQPRSTRQRSGSAGCRAGLRDRRPGAARSLESTNAMRQRDASPIRPCRRVHGEIPSPPRAGRRAGRSGRARAAPPSRCTASASSATVVRSVPEPSARNVIVDARVDLAAREQRPTRPTHRRPTTRNPRHRPTIIAGRRRGPNRLLGVPEPASSTGGGGSTGGGSTPSTLRNTISSPSASTTIVSPAWNSFQRIFSDSGSSTRRWIARRSGRAPSAAS